MWSPRLYRPLLLAFKAEFLDTANHYADLADHDQQFAAIFTYAALGPLEGYTAEEFREAFATFPLKALQEAAQALSQALEGAGSSGRSTGRSGSCPSGSISGQNPEI